MTTLKEELRTSAEFASLQQEAYLSLIVTVDRIHRRHTEFMNEFGISPKQYNILRILRGAGRAGLPVMEIGRRMVEKSPDISRIITRLIDQGLVNHRRKRRDRRVVMVTISNSGLKPLEKMDEPIGKHIVDLLSGLKKDELKTLIDLLDKTRDSVYRASPD